MALEYSLWQRNKRNFILFIIVGAVVFVSALAFKAYRNRKRFNTYPRSTLPLTTANSNSSISSTEVELRSSSSPTTSSPPKPSIPLSPLDSNSSVSSTGVELRSSSSPREPEQHDKVWELQEKLIILALSFLFATFFVAVNRGLLGITIIMALVFGYPCFLATKVAIKSWRLQLAFSVRRKGVVVEGQIRDRREKTEHRKIRRHFSLTKPGPFTKYEIQYSYAYDGKTYSRWLELSGKRFQAIHKESRITVHLLSNMPTLSYLKGFNQIRGKAVGSTSIAICCLAVVLAFVFQFLSNPSYLINGDPPAAPSSIIPGIPNTFLSSTPDSYFNHVKATPALDEWLNNNSQIASWDEKNTKAGRCIFEGNSYNAVATSSPYYHTCRAQKPNFENSTSLSGDAKSAYTYKVEMMIIQGDCGGLLFGMDSTKNKFYDFRLCQDGTYSLLFFNNGISTDLSSALTVTDSAVSIKGLGIMNTVAVTVFNDHIVVYINYQTIGSLPYSTPIGGQIGVAADGSRVKKPTEVDYTGAEVWLS